jgi:hypothetical protein
LPAIVGVAVVYVLLPVALTTLSRYRQLRLLRCPETGKECWVRFDAARAAHIDKENQILFPLAKQILAEEEQRAPAQAFDAVEHVVVGPGIHERLLLKLGRIEAAADGPAGRGQA